MFGSGFHDNLTAAERVRKARRRVAAARDDLKEAEEWLRQCESVQDTSAATAAHIHSRQQVRQSP